MINGFLELDNAALRYDPCSKITGVARWTSDERLKQVCVRTFWTTCGKGTTDQGDGETYNFERPRQTDEQRFELRLPEGPYSFNGRLIALSWQLELAIDDESIATLDFILSPFATKIILSEVLDSKPTSFGFIKRT